MNNCPLESTSGKRGKPASSHARSVRSAPEFYDAIPISDLEVHAGRWMRDCRMRGHTKASQNINFTIVSKLLWFLKREEYPECGEDELREFLLYAQEGHLQPHGRWGDGERAVSPHAFKPLARSTVRTYYNYLKILFSWLVEHEVMELSPMRRISAPECQENQREGFSENELAALLEAAGRSTYGKRDRALILFMVDSGARASEVCGILLEDVDLEEQRVLLHGKGVKERQIYFGVRTSRALYDYLNQSGRDLERDAHEPLFLSERGSALTPSGLLCIFRRLRKSAGIRGRCYPHMMRRTFATEFLTAGAPIKAAQRQLGHTTTKMTMEYLYSSDARLKDNHRRFSPADRMLKK